MESPELENIAEPGFVVSGADIGSSNVGLNQFVAFSIGDRNFCVDIMQVREIRAWTGATSLPNSADYVRGVINLRGNIVPVIDLRSRFGHGLTDAEGNHVVVIVMIGDSMHGLLVDSVSDILDVGDKDIAQVPDTELGARANFLDGIITDGDDMVAIISLDRLIAQDMNAAA
jgi:purine-binding chemotaxis protein CheW